MIIMRIITKVLINIIVYVTIVTPTQSNRLILQQGLIGNKYHEN